jgi:hypothetical protein
MPVLCAVALAWILLIAPASAKAPVRNGFSLQPAGVPIDEILKGGPSRDGIPALDHPPSLPPAEAPWKDVDLVLGVEWKGEARAYPIAILDWHELVNDTLGGRPILVSYCPLCGTGIVFDRRVEGAVRRFGVSGLLYRSDLLMYDRETESLWSQISAEAVTGPSLGRRLALLRSRIERFGEWKRSHPETTVLSRETGYRRSYARSPYGSYAVSERLAFPAPLDRRYYPKMPTLGLRIEGGDARAYPALEVVRAGGVIRERFDGKPVEVAFDSEDQVFRVAAPDSIEVVQGYWFAWAAFHPHTSVFVSAGSRKARGVSGE